jgi:hypothetical protein
MQTLSRRGLLVAGGTGAAATALAACGGSAEDPRDDGRDPELLAAALAAETALGDAYTSARPAPGPQRAVYTDFAASSKRRASDLESLLGDAGGSAEDAASTGTAVPIDAANAAIAAYREAAGPLSTEKLRGTAIAYAASVAAEVAVLSELAGDDPAPRAFVTGLAEEPYVAAEDGSASPTTTSEDGETTTEEQP